MDLKASVSRVSFKRQGSGLKCKASAIVIRTMSKRGSIDEVECWQVGQVNVPAAALNSELFAFAAFISHVGDHGTNEGEGSASGSVRAVLDVHLDFEQLFRCQNALGLPSLPPEMPFGRSRRTDLGQACGVFGAHEACGQRLCSVQGILLAEKGKSAGANMVELAVFRD